MKTQLENFGFKRKSGILLPVSSLPSKYGIGSFGKEAHRFIDFLCDTKQKCWQVLPLNPTSYGDSPYQSPASASLNPYFIDLEILHGLELLTKSELDACKKTARRINYGELFYERYDVLRLAHSRFQADEDYAAFLEKNRAWLDTYALFMALKVHYAYRPWTTWDPQHKSYALAIASADEFSAECDFWRWVQYELDREWSLVRKHAKSKGIMIIGDMPIYVAHDSADVWSNTDGFLLDEDYMPRVVAGCPPDAYSEDGQLWGNPIYDWDGMRRRGFDWWLARIGRAFELYDILRIDHFRGFASYYSIPYGDENAKRGQWIEAPGLDLFRAVRNAYPRAKIIAEDLGLITDDVRELLRRTGFPGMKLLQFAFFEEDGEYLPRNYKDSNCVAYTASHDSDCTRSWADDLSGNTLSIFEKECPIDDGESRTHALVRLAMQSRANLCVTPIQDLLELTNGKGRMNTPSVPYGNWTYRMKFKYDTQDLKNKIVSLTVDSKRA